MTFLTAARMPSNMKISREVVMMSVGTPRLHTSLVYIHNPTIVQERHQLNPEVESTGSF